MIHPSSEATAALVHHRKMESGLVLVLLLCGLGIGAHAQCSQTDNSCKNCPPGWTSFQGRCYLFVDDKMDWADAERYCNFLDGNLSSILSKEEYDFIRDLIFKATGKNPRTWAGATDATKLGYGLWSDGSTYDQNFSFWGPGEPDMKAIGANCMEINMNDIDFVDNVVCSQLNPFVCGRNP
ncbi:galactose-specific lectin nattectin [Austrofundulus limnaeus]|uniref:Galactose-specific lectin nattectin n=1 Tax=Austrofundulus limnaeus TaxID=52670 RepID=A0A2I4CJN5_AUSLI|nr:PREDICTED: galactose-specific lectin nattectin-like [Austrofundulus limnaeus]